MASISQGIVLTTAMLFSSTVLYLAFSTHKPSPSPPFQIPHNPNSQNPNNKQILRSCLYSDEKKRESDKKKKKKKKKRVKFSESVMVKEVKIENYDGENREEKQNREERRKQNRASPSKSCRNVTGEIRGMPANRIALYNGILRDRGHRMAFCY